MTGPAKKTENIDLIFKNKITLSTSRIYIGDGGDLCARLRGDGYSREFKNIENGSFLNGYFSEILQNSTVGNILAIESILPLNDSVFTADQGGLLNNNGDNMFVNIVDDFGADNTGTSNTTTQIQNAINGTRPGQIIFFPEGTYLVTPGVLDFSSRRFIGEFAHTSLKTVIKADSSGTNLINVNSRTHIEKMVFAGNNLVQTSLFVGSAHDSVLRDIQATSALNFAIRIQYASLFGQNIKASNSERGISLEATNGSTFYGLSAGQCNGVGIKTTGGAAGEPQSGQFSLFGFTIDFANKDGYESQMLVDGNEGAYFHGAYIEGNGTGLIVDSNAHNCIFDGLRFVGGGPFTMVDLKFSRKNTFIGLSAAGEQDGFNRFLIDTGVSGNRKSEQNTFIGCFRESRLSSEGCGLTLSDGTTTWTARTGQNNFIVANSAPTVGLWFAGDTILSESGSPWGWKCVSKGVPGTWVALG